MGTRMEENVINSDLNLPEPTRARIHTIPDVPGRSCCSTTRVAVLVTEIIMLLLIVVCQILPCKRHCSRTQVAVLVVVLVPIVVALTLSWTLPHGPTVNSHQDSTTTIPAEAPDFPTVNSHQDSTTTIPAEAPGCPPAWKKHGRKCYFFFPEWNTKDWNGSRAECTAMGSDLVVIDSREELVRSNSWGSCSGGWSCLAKG
ncbi:uncharacterized protein GJ701_003792 [Geothlypis trichas]